MINLLSQRLINAKRELTALKTAHTRGLGTIKIYETEHYYADDSLTATGDYEGTLTVNFPTNYAAYPYVYILPTNDGTQPWNVRTFSADTLGFRYTNNGYTAVFDCEIFFRSGSVYDHLVVVSTAPPSSITGSWSPQ